MGSFDEPLTEHDPTHPQGASAKPLHLGVPFGKRRPGGGLAEGALVRAPSGRLGQGALAEPAPQGAFWQKGALGAVWLKAP